MQGEGAGAGCRGREAKGNLLLENTLKQCTAGLKGV